MRNLDHLQDSAAVEPTLPKAFTFNKYDTPMHKKIACKPGLCGKKCTSTEHMGPTMPESSVEEDSTGLMSTFWTTFYSMNTTIFTRYVADELTKTNALSTTLFKTEPSTLHTAKNVNLCFPFRVGLKASIQLANLTLDILLLVLAEQEADGIRTWVFWMLLSLRILPVPLLLLRPMKQRGSFLLKILNLSSFVEIHHSWKNGEWCDELVVIDILEAFLTTLPSAIIQLLVLITQVERYTNTWIITALASSLSVVCAASKLQGVEFLVFGVSIRDYRQLLRSCLYYLYAIIDVAQSTFFIAVCVENFSSVLCYDIYWGCCLLAFRYISRVLLHLGIYCKRGSVRRGGSSNCCTMLAVGLFVSGPMEWLTGLIFLHEVALQGLLWLFALQLLWTLELAALMYCIYKDEGSVLHDEYLYALICIAGLQLLKQFLLMTKRYREHCHQSHVRTLPLVQCQKCGNGTFVRSVSRFADL